MQTDKLKSGRRGRQRVRQTETDKQKYIHTDRQTIRHTDKQKDRQTDRQTDRLTHRQTTGHNKRYGPISTMTNQLNTSQ